MWGHRTIYNGLYILTEQVKGFWAQYDKYSYYYYNLLTARRPTFLNILLRKEKGEETIRAWSIYIIPVHHRKDYYRIAGQKKKKGSTTT